MSLAVAALGLLVGVLIGTVGVGGVLLVPALVYAGGLDIRVAIASCLLAYLGTGLVGSLAYARRGSLPRAGAGWLCAGAVPGALLGALGVAVVPERALEALVAVLVSASGAQALAGLRQRSGEGRPLGAAALVSIGALTGLGSALSGTGGPLILLPILTWARQPPLVALGYAQLVQVPIAAFASAANLRYGRPDVALGLGLAVALGAGVLLGARLAHRLPAPVLRRAVAVALLAAGVAMIGRALAA